jgi:hypothetical protein
MSVSRFRRGVEFDAFHALRALPTREHGNLDTRDVGELASFHFEKLAYICDDVHYSVVEDELKLLAQSITAAAKEYAGGEKYYLHQEAWESEIQGRLESFLEGSRNNTPRPL